MAKRYNKRHQLRRRYNRGIKNGYRRGYKQGWTSGAQAFSEPFYGTSIIIPTHNKKDFLRLCIESIQTYTPEPHEIIVIDNGSSDGTHTYLQSLKRTIRYKILSENRGFAGGVNQGLMMARGTSILILNNDTIMTANWLHNLLVCLYSNPKNGLVGPVTNYISGEQLIATSYQSIPEMHQFSHSVNQSNAARWKITERLTGFCVLASRETFRCLGYWDEGFVIGNCEDDDYGLRTRLSGLNLVIATNSFIHHFGSTSIKALGEQKFAEVYGNNLAFYSRKWPDPKSLMEKVTNMNEGVSLNMVDFYPTYTLVKGPDPSVFWIDKGIRRPIHSDEAIQFTRISKVDLWKWPIGEPISRDEIQDQLQRLSLQYEDVSSLPEGILVRTPDSKIYQVKQGKVHHVINMYALETWHMEQRGAHFIAHEDILKYPEGMPIIAPPVILSSNL